MTVKEGVLYLMAEMRLLFNVTSPKKIALCYAAGGLSSIQEVVNWGPGMVSSRHLLLFWKILIPAEWLEAFTAFSTLIMTRFRQYGAAHRLNLHLRR
jgi:hypothetical protein